MRIEIARDVNALGTVRYDVHAAGRSTHGFRRSPAEARQAAVEDGGLMYLCGRAEREEEPTPERKPLPRRMREKRGAE
jgi:hypothetical protein